MNPLDEPLTDEEREALRHAVLCNRGRKITPRDLKALAQLVLAVQRVDERERGPAEAGPRGATSS